MSNTPLLAWQDGQPFSTLYRDVFFSRTSGLEETRHVFLAQSRLAERWRDLAPRANFIIGETGFGTGLNFLCAWQLWQASAPKDAWLHFFSVEKHPLDPKDLNAALALWPELASLREVFLVEYDTALPVGWHRFNFPSSRTTLTLAIEDVGTALSQLDLEVDAWFLDGFAPSRNPEMWSVEVLQQVARHTKEGGSFATYSAAGSVRRSLQNAGFEVERVEGHGSKREMLRGVLKQTPQPQYTEPWFARPPLLRTEKRAIVIGGGLAGTSSAASLAARGWQVELIERQARIAAETSGNAQGILYARLSGHPTVLRSLVIAGYTYSNRLLKRLMLSPDDYSPCGVLQLAFDSEEAERQRQLLAQAFPAALFQPVDVDAGSSLCGVSVLHPGLWFPQGGWVHPPAFCEALAAHPNVHVRLSETALRLGKSGCDWQVMAGDRCIASAPVLILAAAMESSAFEQSRYLPTTAIRGQITSIPETAETTKLRAVLCGKGYLAPARRGLHTLGATHKFHDRSLEVRAEENAENLAMLKQLAPALNVNSSTTLQGRAGLRSSTPDYLPLVGPLVDAAIFNAIYAPLSQDARAAISTPPPYLDGLYVSAAHGSRGLITAPLAGELLAAYLDGEPAPVGKSVVEALHPSRFLVRNLVRRKS